jgi:hypothetical protein
MEKAIETKPLKMLILTRFYRQFWQMYLNSYFPLPISRFEFTFKIAKVTQDKLFKDLADPQGF